MRRYELVINDTPVTVTVKALAPSQATLEVDGVAYTVRLTREEMLPEAAQPRRPLAGSSAAARPPVHAAPPSMTGVNPIGSVRAPIPGAVLEVYVRAGDSVTAGQALLKMEAMKMENVIAAPIAGRITTLVVAKGSVVEQGQEMLVIA
jgi:biotin carboxyl carrier protein